MDIQVLDAIVLKQITYKRFTKYLSDHGWHKLKDDGEIETWGLQERLVTVMPSISSSNYLSTMCKNLQIIAEAHGQSQIFIVASILGQAKVVVDKDEVIAWKEWSVISNDAEMKIVLYKDKHFYPYEDGDKLISGDAIDMEAIY